ncbi:MAG: helix-turn-helix transcriptional regulator [Pseudomonadota bacterium]
MHKRVIPCAQDRTDQFEAVPSISLSTEDICLEERFTYWNDVNQPNYSLHSIGSDLNDFTASFDCWRAGGIAVADARFASKTPGSFVFRYERPAVDVLRIRAFEESDQRGFLGDETTTLSAGEVHFFPYCTSVRTFGRRLEQTTAYVPFELVGYDPSKYPTHKALSSISPMSSIIRSTLTLLLNGFRHSSSDDAVMAVHAFTGLIRGFLNNSEELPTTSHELFKRARGEALRSFIRNHILNKDLGVQMVCTAFGASRATVYREFEEEGGVARHIQSLRLERAKLDLEMSSGARGTVSEIARRYAFPDIGSFSKAFRRQFGAPPGEFVVPVVQEAKLQSLSALESPIDTSPSLHNWIVG